MKYNINMGVYSPEKENVHIVEEIVIALVVVSLGVMGLAILFI